MRAYKVSGNNEGLYSEAAYQELRLQLSTGDFHTHKAELVTVPGDDYDKVIQIDELVPGSCRICERLGCNAEPNEDVSFPICQLCYEDYKLHHERFPIEGELKRLRDRFYDAITFKQFHRIDHGNYFDSLRRLTKSRKLLSLIQQMEDAAARAMAYKTAEDELTASIKLLGGFKH